MSDGGWDGIPADVFLNILLRIPLCPRRRLRLICRHWHDVIDERAPEPRACAKVLAFSNDGGRHRAYVVDDLTRGGVSRELDLLHCCRLDAADVRLIGTCNGLLCLLRSHDIAVINPATRELLAVGLPSACYYGRNEATYSFGYHPATGRYKIVHVPHYRTARLDAVRVLTLGDGGPGAAWRDVPAPPGSSCLLRFGLVTVGAGVTYWVTEDAKRIMSLDLKDDRVAVVESPPMPVPLVPFNGYGPEYVNAYPCRLTEVHAGKLGLAARRPCDGDMSKTEVWVLEGGREQEMAWVKRCTVLAGGAVTRQEIALPHAVHGEHVLTTYMPGVLSGRPQLTLSAHRPRDERKTRPCGVVRVGAPKPETVVGVFESCGVRTFAYVETKEPLSMYGDSYIDKGEDLQTR